ncbi:putative secreted protein (Por secretion system target) [Flavobacterium croceum DSM 17960]|jgi:hypothetical protein|uniref:Putative secreted protein (Por secretion system target) n=1 Tax=Flavobacterium croceum DSM 17960 TaxID=1121886 RepID=A0A2S4N938_9FLAO|nr:MULTISPECIES: T9SS type A sorting domain-containing protein [Flavobacterium]POS02190.1 putative secreted protein (Por secretion system target) [Flavobacterium croceum DSM 17960]HQA74623.1 T9SS type A sorting domain-containing protein [Flavobacterium sp.]
MKTKQLFFLFSFLFFLKANAQQSLNAAGGDATGSNGKISYSIGQIDYVSATGSNGSVSQGVQQPFEIFTLGTDDFPNIILQAIVYPNPTSSNINLIIENYSIDNLHYNLYDIQGRSIANQKITQQETNITMENLQNANYFLQVFDNNKTLKTFKIIKN